MATQMAQRVIPVSTAFGCRTRFLRAAISGTVATMGLDDDALTAASLDTAKAAFAEWCAMVEASM